MAGGVSGVPTKKVEGASGGREKRPKQCDLAFGGRAYRRVRFPRFARPDRPDLATPTKTKGRASCGDGRFDPPAEEGRQIDGSRCKRRGTPRAEDAPHRIESVGHGISVDEDEGVGLAGRDAVQRGPRNLYGRTQKGEVGEKQRLDGGRIGRRGDFPFPIGHTLHPFG